MPRFVRTTADLVSVADTGFDAMGGGAPTWSAQNEGAPREVATRPTICADETDSLEANGRPNKNFSMTASHQNSVTGAPVLTAPNQVAPHDALICTARVGVLKPFWNALLTSWSS